MRIRRDIRGSDLTGRTADGAETDAAKTNRQECTIRACTPSLPTGPKYLHSLSELDSEPQATSDRIVQAADRFYSDEEFQDINSRLPKMKSIPSQILLVAISLFVAGCSGASNGPSAEGKSFLATTPPDAPTGVVDLKNNLIAGLAVGPSVVEGRVGGLDNETFDPNQAAFMIRDLNLKDETHDHGGDSSHCEFCQANKLNQLESMALVRLVDESGNVVQKDAQSLLGLKDNQIVIVEGEGVIEDGTMVFNASKIFIRP